MSGWIFARGRINEQILGEVAPAGATVFALPGADLLFAPGQLLLASEADGAETEWLGRVTATDAQELRFSRPLAAGKNSGARVWAAASALVTPAQAARPLRRALHTGVALDRTRAGGLIAVAAEAPAERLTLALEGLTPATEQAALDWLAAQTGWGLHPFTLIDPAGAWTAVHLAGGETGGEAPLHREADSGGRRRLTLSLWVCAGEGWQ